VSRTAPWRGRGQGAVRECAPLSVSRYSP
jgi:hypothetical protein